MTKMEKFVFNFTWFVFSVFLMTSAGVYFSNHPEYTNLSYHYATYFFCVIFTRWFINRALRQKAI